MPDTSIIRQRRGARILDRVHATLTDFVVFPFREAPDAATLWIAATHAQRVAHHATRLTIRSPEKQCGKSRLLDLIEATSRRPMVTVNTSVSALFRSIGEEDPPTIIMDEADTIFGRKAAESAEELRGLLNAGFGRDRPVTRCVGPAQRPTSFPTFAMVALAAIGDVIPDTVTDRAVNIMLQKRTAAETVKPYRIRRDGPQLVVLREQLARWIEGHLDELANAAPELPIEDRAADLWEPLVAIADLAGGDWPERARAASTLFTEAAQNTATERNLNVLLLADLRQIFQEAGEPSFMTSADVVADLRGLEASPWERFELRQHDLARRLKTYDVRPGRGTLPSGERSRGYHRADLGVVFERYLTEDAEDASDASDATDASAEDRETEPRWGPVASFLDDACVIGEGLEVAEIDLRREYRKWARDLELEPLEPGDFRFELRQLVECRRSVGMWRGLALADQ